MGPITATIRADSPRAGALRLIFGDDPIPLKSPLPVMAELPGLGVYPVLLVDVAALAAERLERAVDHIAKTFGEQPDTVRRDLLGEHGLPILADELIVLLPIVPIGSA